MSNTSFLPTINTSVADRVIPSTATEQYTRNVYIDPFSLLRSDRTRNMFIAPLKTSENDLFSEISKDIMRYALLDEDWDGYGGSTPSEEVIALSINFLSQINYKDLPLPNHMVSGDGALSLYWEDKEASIYIEVAFDESNSYSYLIRTKDDLEGKDDISLIRDGVESSIVEHIKSIQIR